MNNCTATVLQQGLYFARSSSGDRSEKREERKEQQKEKREKRREKRKESREKGGASRQTQAR